MAWQLPRVFGRQLACVLSTRPHSPGEVVELKSYSTPFPLSSIANLSLPTAAPLNGPCLSLFGQILTHPSRVTFPWAPLRHALYTYFGSPPTNLDPHKIGAGWCGLSLILTAFKRLEVVESQEETQEVLSWLAALKIAAVRRRYVWFLSLLLLLWLRSRAPLSRQDASRVALRSPPFPCLPILRD